MSSFNMYIPTRTCEFVCPQHLKISELLVDEVANVAELLLMPQGAFITGGDFLIDGGATASYFYGPLKPAE